MVAVSSCLIFFVSIKMSHSRYAKLNLMRVNIVISFDEFGNVLQLVKKTKCQSRKLLIW